MTDIVYDQPLNEVIRVCLRLEQLFQQIDHQFEDQSMLGTRNVVRFIIDILHILDRPDLKAKLAKELTYHLASLLRFDSRPDVDKQERQEKTQQLEYLSRYLIDSNGKIGQRLREIELLNILRMHLASPGGACSFDTPVFYYWLQQPSEIRTSTLINWLNDFEQIRQVSEVILDLVRHNTKVIEKTATHGFHQELLDSQSPLRMLRIGIPAQIAAHPEISIGRHFFSVRFFSFDIIKRPQQFTDNLTFWVAYCS